MKLIYWIAKQDDFPCYDIRERTKKAAQAAVEQAHGRDYAPVHKVTVEYRDAFDLVTQALDEGGIE